MTASQDINVRICDGAQKAQIDLAAGLGSDRLTSDAIQKAAGDAGVRLTPTVEARIVEIIREYGEGAAELTADLAHAIPPQPGTAGNWIWERAFDPGVAALAETERGEQPASRIFIINAGDVVATYTPATDGVDGQSVTGAVIPAPPGKAASVRPGDGLDLSADGRVTAAQNGILSVAKGFAVVSPLRQIKGSVDDSTGDVDVKGDVQIGGGIREGRKVHASGNIFVDGPVEGAEIVCGGEFVCLRGVGSAKRAKIVVAGRATLGPSRNISAICRSHLTSRESLEQSDVTVGGEFHAELGRFAGGNLTLTGPAFIGTIGSPQRVLTTIRMGDLPLVALEVRRLSAEITRLKAAITAKDEIALTLQCQTSGNSALAREQLTEIQYERAGIVRQIGGLETERARLEEAVARGRSCEIHIGKVVHARVRVQYGQTAYEFDRDIIGPVQVFASVKGEMTVRFPNKEPRPISDFATQIRATPARKSA